MADGVVDDVRRRRREAEENGASSGFGFRVEMLWCGSKLRENGLNSEFLEPRLGNSGLL